MADDKDEKIAKARQLAESGKLVMAINAWRQLLDDTPHNDATVYNTIGDLCLRNKDTREAIDAYQHAARCYLQEGFHLKAIALYKKVLKLDPNRADIYALLGDLNVVRGLLNNAVADYVSGAKTYLKAGKTMNALTLFQKIIKVDSKNTAIRRRVADLCLEENLTDQAIEEYFRIGQEYQRLGQAEEAGKCYERILAIAPGHQAARRGLENPQAPVVVDLEDRISEATGTLDAGPVMLDMTMEPAPTAADPVPAFEVAPEPAIESPAADAFGSAPSECPIEAIEFDVPVEAPVPDVVAAVPVLELAVETPSLDLDMEVEAPVPDVVAAVPVLELAAETPSLGLDMEVEAPADMAAAVVVAAAEEEATPGAMPDVPALVGAAPAMDDVWQALLEPRSQGSVDHGDDETIHRHYDLGVAYKEMGMMVEAIEEFQTAMRGPTRFVEAGAMLAACYRTQQRHRSAISFLTRVLADARCVGPGAPYVKYDLALLCEDEGFAESAAQLYEEIPHIRDAEARLQRLQGIEDPMALPASTH